MPFGAFGGRADVMAVYDPTTAGFLIHNGTFQNNTIMLNAGYVGLSEVYTPEVVESLNSRGDALREKLARIFKGTRLSITGRGSLMCIQATSNGLQDYQITCKDDILAVDDLDIRRLFWIEMLNAGFWVQPRGSLALNLQIPDEAITAFSVAVQDFVDRNRAFLALS